LKKWLIIPRVGIKGLNVMFLVGDFLNITIVNVNPLFVITGNGHKFEKIYKVEITQYDIIQ